MRMLHYNQLSQTSWNGYSTLAEAYNTFDSADVRKNICSCKIGRVVLKRGSP